MLFRRVSVRLKNPLPPLGPQGHPALPAVTPKKWYHFSESPHDRIIRLGIEFHQAGLIDRLKTTLNIKKGSRAAILFHLLSQQGLWDDGALPQIVQFQATRKAQYPTVESAIPAYVAHRNALTPVTKAWVSLIIGTLPLGPVQRRIETDVWKWIQSAAGPHGISQTDLPNFLATHQEIFAQSLHAADTMGRFSDDHSTLVHRLVPLIISAFDKAKPDWKQIQRYTPLKNVLERRNAWLIRDKEKTATDWDQRIGQLSAKTSLSDSEAREYVLRYQTDSAVEHVEIGTKGHRPTEFRSIDIFREFLLNHIEKRIIDSFNPSIDVQPIIAAWQEFRNNAVRTLHRSHLIDAPFYDLLTQRTHSYHAAGLTSQDGAYAENWIHTHTLYSCRQAGTPIDFKMSPTPSITHNGIEAAILNRSPELTHFLPIWRQSTPDRSIHELETRVQDLYRAGLLVGKESAWGSKGATPSPPAPRLFPPIITMPPIPNVRPNTPVKFKHAMGTPFDGGLKSGTNFKILPYSDAGTAEDTRPNSPAIPGYTTAENGSLFPPHTDIVFWFNRVNPLLDQGYSIDDACRILVAFPKFTPHPDDCAQLEALYQKISAKNGSPWTVERVVAVGPLFHDLCQEAILPEATVLPYILELGPEAHTFELRLAQEIKDVQAGQARMITLMAHFRRLSNHADPDVATVKRHGLECFRLHFSIRQIIEFEKNLTPDLSEASVHRLTRRLFFNQFSPALTKDMEIRTAAMLDDTSPHPNPEYLAAEMILRDERTSIYSTQNVSEKWMHIVEGAIGLNYAPPYAITPKDLVLYIKTLSALVTDDQRPRRLVWQRIGITDTGIEWLENRFQTLVDAHDLTQRLILPENFNHSIVDRTPTAFTLALSDYIQHQSDHHQSIYRELGIHPDDMSLLQANLPICTPDESIRAHSDRNLGRSLAALRKERYTRLGIDFDKSKSEFEQFAPLRGESKTAHTRRFLDAVQAQAALKLRREVYEMEKISSTEVPYHWPGRPEPMKPHYNAELKWSQAMPLSGSILTRRQADNRSEIPVFTQGLLKSILDHIEHPFGNTASIPTSSYQAPAREYEGEIRQAQASYDRAVQEQESNRRIDEARRQTYWGYM